jgi:hypothetical protein
MHQIEKSDGNKRELSLLIDQSETRTMIKATQ